MIGHSDVLNGKILVVDDQERTARSLAEMLQDAGYADVSFTTNPNEVQQLHQQNLSLIHI